MAGGTAGNSTVLLQVINPQKIVCPTREELQVEHGDYVCPSEGCDKVFQVSSQLQMHIARHHHGQKLTGGPEGGSLSRDCVYYCPVEGCPRNKVNGQPFPRLGQLKQVCMYDSCKIIRTRPFHILVPSISNKWMISPYSIITRSMGAKSTAVKNVVKSLA